KSALQPEDGVTAGVLHSLITQLGRTQTLSHGIMSASSALAETLRWYSAPRAAYKVEGASNSTLSIMMITPRPATFARLSSARSRMRGVPDESGQNLEPSKWRKSTGGPYCTAGISHRHLGLRRPSDVFAEPEHRRQSSSHRCADRPGCG